MNDIKIEIGKELKMENLLSLRKKMKQSEIVFEMQKIGYYFQKNGIKRAGPIVNTTYNIENVNGEQIIDVEILVPMDKKYELSGEYKLKEKFHLLNAVYANHKGNPAFLQQTYEMLFNYIQNNNLQQITPAYNVNVKELAPGESADEMVIDVYIGISPNIL